VADPADNARIEAIYRQVNEGIALINAGWEIPALELICECSMAGCTERVELTLEEYERVRSVPTHFVLRPGHDDPGSERVIRGATGWIVVESLGAAANVAEETDPRRGSG